jgi:Ser/Thr protein kinase RdoA (MazF antagonist)
MIDAVVRRTMDEWNGALEQQLLETKDASEVVALVVQLCRDVLGAEPCAWLFYMVSVGAVHGIELDDGRRVVVKLHRNEVEERYLRALNELRVHAARGGLPAPLPLADPTRCRNALATFETFLDDGDAPDARVPALRARIAEELARFVDVCRSFSEPERLRSWFVPTGDDIWPPPHDPRFRFAETREGAAWIDAIGRRALARLSELDHEGCQGERVVGHGDWRREHLRFHGERLATIWDWDSVLYAEEPRIVASAMRTFSTDWTSDEHARFPSREEMFAFLEAYESARGRPFSLGERRTLSAALAYGAAYTARCEHSDRATDFGQKPARDLVEAAPEGSQSAFLRDHWRDLLEVL